MRVVVRTIAATLVVALVGSPASAQRTGTRIGKIADTSDGRNVAQMMADCWVERQQGKARRWMDTIPGAADEQTKVFGDLREFQTCMEDQRLVMDDKSLSFKPQMMRRPVAIKLVKDALRKNATIAVPAPDTSPWYVGKLPTDGRYDASALSMQAFGHCVALADWAHGTAMLRAVPDSDGEIAAFRALVPSLGPCVPENERVALTRTMVREVLAEPMYHLMSASSGGGKR